MKEKSTSKSSKKTHAKEPIDFYKVEFYCGGLWFAYNSQYPNIRIARKNMKLYSRLPAESNYILRIRHIVGTAETVE